MIKPDNLIIEFNDVISHGSVEGAIVNAVNIRNAISSSEGWLILKGGPEKNFQSFNQIDEFISNDQNNLVSVFAICPYNGYSIVVHDIQKGGRLQERMYYHDRSCVEVAICDANQAFFSPMFFREMAIAATCVHWACSDVKGWVEFLTKIRETASATQGVLGYSASKGVIIPEYCDKCGKPLL